MLESVISWTLGSRASFLDYGFTARVSLRWLAVIGLTLGSGCGSRDSHEALPETSLSVTSLKDDDAEKSLLSDSARRYLWDIEHLAFVAEQKLLPRVNAGFVKSDRSALRPLFAEDFRAELLSEMPSEETRSGPIRCQLWSRANGQSRSVSVEEFLDHLLAFRGRLGAESCDCNSSIGLVKWGPVKQGDMFGPWQSVWRIRFSSRQDARPMEVVLQVRLGMDTVNEALPERTGWIRSAVVEQVTIVEADSPLMKDVTAESGIDNSLFHDNWRKKKEFLANTGGAYLNDFNQDGLLDVLIADQVGGIRLYQGLGDSRFRDVTQSAGLPVLEPGRNDQGLPLWAAASWADLDGDGDEDLVSEDKLFENLGDGTFREVTKQSNLLLTPTTGYAVADFDNDGRVDLYVCHSGAYRIGQRERSKVEWIDGGLGIDNVLWRNLGDWQFEDVTETTNTGGGGRSTFAAVWFDANRDGRPDLLPINEFGRNPVLMQQPDGRFKEQPLDPVFDGLSMGVTAGDYNNDGLTDIYVANMYSKAGARLLANVDEASYPADVLAKIKESVLGSKLYRARGDGQFDVLSADRTFAAVGWAYGANFADFNGDGFADLYATAGFKSEQRGKPDG